MKKSALQTARASYQPKLPEAIKNGVTIVEGHAIGCRSGGYR